MVLAQGFQYNGENKPSETGRHAAGSRTEQGVMPADQEFFVVQNITLYYLRHWAQNVCCLVAETSSSWSWPDHNALCGKTNVTTSMYGPGAQ